MTEERKLQKKLYLKAYYLKNRESLIKKNIQYKRIKNGVVVGQRKNPWLNAEYREKILAIRSKVPPARYWLGKKFSEETKKKLSTIRQGKSATWNIGRKLTEEHKNKISKKLMGRPGQKGKKGHPISMEARKRMSEERRGEKSHRWEGGKTSLQKTIRNSMEYRMWRSDVFKRDDYQCVFCNKKFIKGVTGKIILHADHIKPFATFPELRFDINNGRTLCYDCHKKTDTWGGKRKVRP